GCRGTRRAAQSGAQPGRRRARARSGHPGRALEPRSRGPRTTPTKRSRRARPWWRAPALASRGLGGRAPRRARLESHQRAHLRIHALGGPVGVPDDLNVYILHALERPEHPVGVISDHRPRRAARRRERHLHPYLAVDDLYVVHEAEIDDAHVELRILYLPERLADRVVIERHGRRHRSLLAIDSIPEPSWPRTRAPGTGAGARRERTRVAPPALRPGCGIPTPASASRAGGAGSPAQRRRPRTPVHQDEPSASPRQARGVRSRTPPRGPDPGTGSSKADVPGPTAARRRHTADRTRTRRRRCGWDGQAASAARAR